jgi:hypothetical protein
LRAAKKKRSRTGTILVAGGFFVGTLLIASAITLAVLPPSTDSSGVRVGQGGQLRAPEKGLASTGVASVLPARASDAGALAPVEPDGGASRDAGLASEAPSGDAAAGRAEDARQRPASAIEETPRTSPREEEKHLRTVPLAELRPGAGQETKVRPSGPDQREPGGRSEQTQSHGGTKEVEPRSKAMGYLTVWTTPYSKVFLDSQLLGTTPMAKREVPPGRHRLKLVNPDLPPKTISISVKAGEVTRVREQL